MGFFVPCFFPFFPDSGTLAGVVILTSGRPDTALGKVKWFGATKGYGFIQPSE
jgi:hypothetical protein